MNFSQFVHPHCKVPWINLVCGIVGMGYQHGMAINAYQAEGGLCWKTLALAFVLSCLNGLCMSTFYLLLPLIFVLAFWVLAIYHGYMVFQASKDMTPC